MKASLELWRVMASAVGISALVLGIAVQAFAQSVEPAKKAPVAAPLTESQTQGHAILMRMAEFLQERRASASTLETATTRYRNPVRRSSSATSAKLF